MFGLPEKDVLYLIRLRFCGIYFICNTLPDWSGNKDGDWDIDSVPNGTVVGIDPNLVSYFSKLPEYGEYIVIYSTAEVSETEGNKTNDD